MRLWHKDLIPILPRQQLIGQWRECCLIAKNISEKGNPNHLLVNKIIQYPLSHFLRYAELIQIEMKKRGYNADIRKFHKYFDKIEISPSELLEVVDESILFYGWHDDRYLKQCFYNLQEKFDCGGITEKDWATICIYVKWGIS